MIALCRLLLVALLLALPACAATENPASLWISYSQREVDLVLIDHEPPPF